MGVIMNQPDHLAELFDRLSDLKSVFRYGQRLIPVIQSLLEFMRETVPLLENINTSITESTKKIPKASDHLSNVTSATELATTEILDLVDIISNDIEFVEKSLTEARDEEKIRTSVINNIIGQIKDETIVEQLSIISSGASGFDNALETISRIKNNSYNITLSLQVQDITSQQLAAVNHLILSVQEKLSTLVSSLDKTNVDELALPKFTLPDSDAFNENAVYSKDGQRQKLADELIGKKNITTSQEEIDKMFA